MIFSGDSESERPPSVVPERDPHYDCDDNSPGAAASPQADGKRYAGGVR